MIERRMVQSQDDPTKYNERSIPQMNRMTTPLWLEGVDGDEETDTVTYWYTRLDPDMKGI